VDELAEVGLKTAKSATVWLALSMRRSRRMVA
jgi:hypothetical protein